MVTAHMKAPLTKKTFGSMKASPIEQMERIKSVEIGNEKAKIQWLNRISFVSKNSMSASVS